MAGQIIETWESRGENVSTDDPSAEFHFTIIDVADEAEAHSLVQAALWSQPIYRGKVYRSYNLAPQGRNIFKAIVRYGKYTPTTIGTKKVSFRTSGGTVHIQQSRETVHWYSVLGEDTAEVPDFGQLIGVHGDQVDGTDVPSRKLELTVTKKWDWDQLIGGTPNYLVDLFQLTGTTNLHPYTINFPGDALSGFTFEQGELVFLGVSDVQEQGYDPDTEHRLVDITYQFAASPNEETLTIGDITPIYKKGWEYLWVLYSDTVDQNVLIKVPEFVYVERVMDEKDFGALLL